MRTNGIYAGPIGDFNRVLPNILHFSSHTVAYYGAEVQADIFTSRSSHEIRADLRIVASVQRMICTGRRGRGGAGGDGTLDVAGGSLPEPPHRGHVFPMNGSPTLPRP
jgi:hypothetical protein